MSKSSEGVNWYSSIDYTSGFGPEDVKIRGCLVLFLWPLQSNETPQLFLDR